jgi:hypothetical protein
MVKTFRPAHSFAPAFLLRASRHQVERWVPGAGEVGENGANASDWGIVKSASEIERSPSDVDEFTVFYLPLPQIGMKARCSEGTSECRAVRP